MITPLIGKLLCDGRSGNDDESGPVIDRIDDSVSALPEPILVLLIRQFFRSNRTRFYRERVDSSHKSLAILLRPNRTEFLDADALI